jgi:hypothetical protein
LLDHLSGKLELFSFLYVAKYPSQSDKEHRLIETRSASFFDDSNEGEETVCAVVGVFEVVVQAV